MIAVILNHLYGPHLYGQLTYPFELVGFFFVAGYTFNMGNGLNEFLRRKAQSLLIPVFSLGLLNATLSFYTKGGSFSSRIVGLFLQIPGVWDDMWFIVCLFTMEILFYFILRFTLSFSIISIICFALSIMGYLLMTFVTINIPWHIENACLLIMFLYLGYFMKNSVWGKHLIAYWRSSMSKYILCIMIVIYTIFVLVFGNYPIDVHLHKYGCFLVFFLSAWLGLCVVLNLSILSERWCNFAVMRFISYIGANTLVYYAFQSKVISLVQILGAKMGFSYCTYIGSVICCMLICMVLIIPSFFIKRYMPLLLGKF